MKNGIISLGEALIDFIPLDQDNMTFQKSPGGAPANVAVGLARLGAKATFLGKVGDDVLGHFLKETLRNYGVNTENMYFSKGNRTGVVFVTLDNKGERNFNFYIDPSADCFLAENEINGALFEEHTIFHFGSISLINEPSRSATVKAINLAKKNKLLLSFDPNIRLDLWKTDYQARGKIIAVLSDVSIVKLSVEELSFLTQENDIHAGEAKLRKYNIPLLYVTAGSNGNHVFFKQRYIHVPAVETFAVDTTGAGDAFMSALLYQFNKKKKHINRYTMDEVKTITHFANISGSIVVATKGAMSALPTLAEMKKYVDEGM